MHLNHRPHLPKRLIQKFFNFQQCPWVVAMYFVVPMISKFISGIHLKQRTSVSYPNISISFISPYNLFYQLVYRLTSIVWHSICKSTLIQLEFTAFSFSLRIFFIASLSGHDNRVTSICMAPNGMALTSCSWDQYARVWG